MNEQVWTVWSLFPSEFIATYSFLFRYSRCIMKYAPRTKLEAINYGVARYGMEVRRLLSVLENHMVGKTWILGDEYSICDMAIYPWVVCLDKGYFAEKFIGRNQRYPNVMKWCSRMEARPAVQRGMLVCGGPGAQEKLRKLMTAPDSSKL